MRSADRLGGPLACWPARVPDDQNRQALNGRQHLAGLRQPIAYWCRRRQGNIILEKTDPSINAGRKQTLADPLTGKIIITPEVNQ